MTTTPATAARVRHAVHMSGAPVLPWSTRGTREGLRIRETAAGVEIVADWSDPEEAAKRALWILHDLRSFGWVCELDGPAVVTVTARNYPTV